MLCCSELATVSLAEWRDGVHDNNSAAVHQHDSSQQDTCQRGIWGHNHGSSSSLLHPAHRLFSSPLISAASHLLSPCSIILIDLSVNEISNPSGWTLQATTSHHVPAPPIQMREVQPDLARCYTFGRSLEPHRDRLQYIQLLCQVVFQQQALRRCGPENSPNRRAMDFSEPM